MLLLDLELEGMLLSLEGMLGHQSGKLVLLLSLLPGNKRIYYYYYTMHSSHLLGGRSIVWLDHHVQQK